MPEPHPTDKTQPPLFVEERTQNISAEPSEIAATMEGLGMSGAAIQDTSVVIDGKNRRSYNGSQTPKWLDRLAQGDMPYNQGKGSVVRIGTKVRGRERTEEQMNKVLVHELEHAAQKDRKDKNIVVGNILIYGGSFALGALGNILAKRTGLTGRALATGAGLAIGNRLGYQFAPHERQARERAQALKSSAIKKI